MHALLADVLVVLHLAYVASVLIGELLFLLGGFLNWAWVRNPWVRSGHLLMIAIVAAEAVCGVQCPLTTWEVQLRERAGQWAGDQPISFVGRITRDVLFYDAPERVLTACYVAFLLLVAGTWVWIRPRPFRAGSRPATI